MPCGQSPVVADSPPVPTRTAAMAGAGQPLPASWRCGQADTQLAMAPAAASPRRTRISHQDRRYWQTDYTKSQTLSSQARTTTGI